jgi:nitrogen-specific signal transduction histidine kinase/ActR/RegA family two-component response regulator
MRDERGRIVGASKIARDISLRKQADAALAQARDEAEAANRAKDDFLAVLSHELRTPLTPALAAASSLQSLPKLDEADLRESLTIIRRNIELEAKLVDDLLDVTRIARGKLGLQTAPVDIHVVLNDAVRMAEAAAKGKGITLVLEFTPGEVLVRGDVVRLTQIFANLLANAVKFTPEEGRVTVRTSRHGGRVRIDVADTGVGIAREEIQRIFDPFRQGGVGTSRRYGGLGLGLSVAKGFVQAHGGTIRADSEGQGRGATFTVELPEISDAAAPPSTRAEPRPISERTAPLRVLLVEDHADTRSVLQRMIAQVGHMVTSVGSVAEARRAIAEGSYDVMLCDLGLPDGTGIDVIGELRRKSNIPAIAMSGYGMDADLARSRAAGFQRHIVKPMVADALLEMLEECAVLADRQTGGRP